MARTQACLSQRKEWYLVGRKQSWQASGLSDWTLLGGLEPKSVVSASPGLWRFGARWFGGLMVRGWETPSYPQQEPGVQIPKPRLQTTK